MTAAVVTAAVAAQAVKLLHGQRSQGRAREREQKAPSAILQRDGFGLGVVPGRAAGAEGGLQFVGAESMAGVEAEAQQHRQRDQGAAAGNGIHKAGYQAGQEQERQVPQLEHRRQAVDPRVGHIHHRGMDLDAAGAGGGRCIAARQRVEDGGLS